MDECTGTAIHDASGLVNDGVLSLGSNGVTSAALVQTAPAQLPGV